MCAPRGEEIERSYSVVKAGPHMGGGVHALNMTYGGPVTPPGCISASLLVTAGTSLWWKKQLFELNL